MIAPTYHVSALNSLLNYYEYNRPYETIYFLSAIMIFVVVLITIRV